MRDDPLHFKREDINLVSETTQHKLFKYCHFGSVLSEEIFYRGSFLGWLLHRVNCKNVSLTTKSRNQLQSEPQPCRQRSDKSQSNTSGDLSSTPK